MQSAEDLQCRSFGATLLPCSFLKAQKLPENAPSQLKKACKLGCRVSLLCCQPAPSVRRSRFRDAGSHT